jgi:hypothetical protein
MNRDNNAKPDGLSALGQKAHKVIMRVLTAHEMTETGGCKSFYSPAEWRKRNEKYGQGAELIVVYDGGSLYPFFNLDAECYELHDEMSNALKEAGLYVEECTGWYAAVYRG